MTPSEPTTCHLCGALVADADKHADWHRDELVTTDDVDGRITLFAEEQLRQGDS